MGSLKSKVHQKPFAKRKKIGANIEGPIASLQYVFQYAILQGFDSGTKYSYLQIVVITIFTLS